jgi:hypothetical protein
MRWAQGGRDHQAAQQDHAGVLPHHRQHLVGDAPGQTGLGEGQADDDGAEDEHHRGVHEIAESLLGRADQEKGLEHADSDGGDADGDDLEDPPDAGHQEQPDGCLALGAEGEDLAGGVDGIGPVGHEVDDQEYRQAQQ